MEVFYVDKVPTTVSNRSPAGTIPARKDPRQVELGVAGTSKGNTNRRIAILPSSGATSYLRPPQPPPVFIARMSLAVTAALHAAAPAGVALPDDVEDDCDDDDDGGP